MGALTAYSMTVAIIVAIEYIVYKSLLANATFYRFNRAVLLCSYVIALTAIPVSGWAVTAYNAIIASADAGNVAATSPVVEIIDTAIADNGSGLLHAIPIIYISGIIIMTLLTLLSYLKMFIIIHKGTKRTIDGATLVISNIKISPFSWGKYIIVSREDADNRLIVEHELNHIRSLHSLDLLFAQLFVIFNWFNPTAYLMRRELSAVHEYDVDTRILLSGVNASDYQMLLIKKAVGPGFQSIANSLNHSQLKNRLTMMMKSKSKKVRLLSAAALLPATIFAVAATNFGVVASTIESVAAVSYDKVNEKDVSSQVSETINTSDNATYSESNTTDTQSEGIKAPETMPEYPGGNTELLKTVMSEIKYPEAAAKAGIEGVVVVRFNVTADGIMQDFSIIKSSKNSELDAEALRALKAISTIKKWQPGTVGGKAVTCKYTIPLRFNINSDKK